MDVSNGPFAAQLSAVVIPRPGETELASMPLNDPQVGQVRVRLEGCGVCSSNLTPWSGPEWMHFPTEPGGLGHEGWGRIDAIGPQVDRLHVGERVAVLSYHAY